MGGGFRSKSQIKTAFSMGVNRVVLGTAVIENPEFGNIAMDLFGSEKIAFGFDVLNGQLMTHGWKKSSGLRSTELALKLISSGAKTLIYTNIARDGMSSGVDWETALDLKREFPIEIIASGGTSSLKDIKMVREAGLDGIIIGRALYEEKFTLKEALDVR